MNVSLPGILLTCVLSSSVIVHVQQQRPFNLLYPINSFIEHSTFTFSSRKLFHALVELYIVRCRAPVQAGSTVERIDLLRFLAGCRKRRLNQALSVLSLSLGF